MPKKEIQTDPFTNKNAHNDFGSLFPCYTRLQSSELQMVWCFCTEGSWGWEHTLPKTKMFSENRPFPKGKQSLNSHFSETMFVVGRIISFSKCFNRKLPENNPKDRVVLLPHGLFLMAYKWWVPTNYKSWNDPPYVGRINHQHPTDHTQRPWWATWRLGSA